MNVALAKDVEDFIKEQVSSGVCTDPSELINDVLRSLRDQQQKQFDITPELETWLLEAADEPSTPLSSSDFEGIRKRVRSSRGS
jgi:putative addiction module CopG family antidote